MKEKYPDLVVKGQDLFDSRFYQNPKSRPAFLSFISNLKELCDAAKPTTAHYFIDWLAERKQLLRLYTQNIDGLELREGMKMAAEKVIALHGQLDKVCCVLCKALFEWSKQIHCDFKEGKSIECSECIRKRQERLDQGKRGLSIGQLRPNIVLYNEIHPKGDLIGESLCADIHKCPSVLMIMGTSLKVVGLKKLVKDMAKAVHASNGIVIFVDLKKAKSEWKSVIDVQLVGDCDLWCERMKEEMICVEKMATIDGYFRKVKSVEKVLKDKKDEKEGDKKEGDRKEKVGDRKEEKVGDRKEEKVGDRKEEKGEKENKEENKLESKDKKIDKLNDKKNDRKNAKKQLSQRIQ